MTSSHTPPPARSAMSDAGWHIKKEIQLGHLLTTLTIAVSVILYISKLEQRIALIEAQVSAQRDRDDRQDRTTGEAMSLLRAQLERMENKLDRVLERK